MSSFSTSVQRAVTLIVSRGIHDKVEYVTLEYLLWGLLQTQEVRALLEDMKINSHQFEYDVEQAINAEKQEQNPLPEGAQPKQTLGFQRVLQRAAIRAQNDRVETIDGIDLLDALLAEKDSMAVYLLEKNGISAQAMQEMDLADLQRAILESSNGAGQEEDDEEDRPKKSALESFAKNLNQEASEGRIDPVIGRDSEILRVEQILCRRRKNNPILVGEAGVGKTAIAEGLAYKIVKGEVPQALKGYEIFSLDLGAMLAGTRYRGDFEERMKELIDEVEKRPKTILFIDEIHQINGAGQSEGGAGDAATLLKPSLAKGTLKVIGATTYDELRKIMSKDSALMRRFQKIDVVEPTVKETIEILKGLRDKFELYHEVKYTDSALQAAAELTARYMTDRKLPDKAIDVIDEAGAAKKLHPTADMVISKTEIENAVSKMARIPPQAVSTDDKKRLKALAQTLKNVIYGQDPAVDAITDAIKLSRSGLGRNERPIGAFLFAGPTGVGKTELARQLSLALGIELIRFDMSEYMERHSVSRLIGAPPGYVGYDQGGLLTEAINKHPHAVLLLDEIEKAHPDIYNILLQVMDHGSLTDNNGKTADFRNVILILTTNVGARDLSRASIGFVSGSHYGDEQAEIKKAFTPEFRNRLDAIISFKPLGMMEIRRVVEKMLLEIEIQLRLKHVDVTFGEDLKAYLAKRGFDPQMGARPMARLIQTTIRRALADELLFGRLVNGGSVSISMDADEKVKLTFKDEDAPKGAPVMEEELRH